MTVKFIQNRGYWATDITVAGRRRIHRCEDEGDAQTKLQRFQGLKKLGTSEEILLRIVDAGLTQAAVEKFLLKKERPTKQPAAASKAEPVDRKELGSAIKEYFEKGMLAKGEDTIRNEKGYLNRWYDFMYDQLEVDYVDQVAYDHIVSWQAHKLNQGLSHAYANRLINPIRHFFVYCVKTGYCESTPFVGHVNFSENPKPAKPWTREIYFAVRLGAKRQGFNWCREFIQALDYTSRRPIDLQRCNWADFDLELSRIRVRSKKGRSGKWQVEWVPIPRRFAMYLDRKRKAARRQFSGGSDQPIFTTGGRARLTTNVLGRALREIRQKIDHEDAELIVSYGIRHGVVWRLKKQNVDIGMISKVVGHKRVTTTQRYGDTGFEDEVRGHLSKREGGRYAG